LQQIATATGSEDSAQTAKDPVVEHKGCLTIWLFLVCSSSIPRLLELAANSTDMSATRRTEGFEAEERPENAPPLPLEVEGPMPRRTIRLTTDVDERIQSAAKLRGYSSPSSFLRAAIQKELGEREDAMIGTEERLAASIEQVRRDVFRLGRTQQALFAFVDSLAKVLLTCVPEPGGEAMEAAVARARGRHARLLKSAGQAMVGDSRVAMQDLVTRGEG
jgi:Arc/MetJ-type ribon-helix-helix transcriptional regulator